MYSNLLSVHKIIHLLISLVWLINGLYCKVLNLVPRHRLIVSKILGEDFSLLATKTIGVLEIGMFFWILSSYKPRFCAISQIVLIGLMNIIEFILVPDLLLFGRGNILIALAFMCIIALNELFTREHPAG